MRERAAWACMKCGKVDGFAALLAAECEPPPPLPDLLQVMRAHRKRRERRTTGIVLAVLGFVGLSVGAVMAES